MIICRSRGFLFLRVPKTASSSISMHLLDEIQFDVNCDAYSSFMGRPAFNIVNNSDAQNEHATLNDFLKSGIINESDLNLKVYGVLRNPIDRTISMFAHVLSMLQRIDISTYSSNNVLEEGLKLFHASPKKYFYSRFANNPNNTRYYPLLPQSNWLMHYGKQISNIIIYPQFKDFLESIEVNPNINYKYKENKTYQSSVEIDSGLKRELRKIYSQDFVLWEKFEMGKNYDSSRTY